MLLDPNQTPQRRVAFRRFGELDQQRRRNFASRGNQFIVGIDLMLDGGRVGKPLGANHLLDLVPDRRRVLEQERQMRSDGEAPALLLVNEERAENRSHAFPLLETQEVVLADFFHFDSSEISGGGTLSGNPLSSYASASTSSGWTGWTP